MKVLVTGATGLIGQSLCARLAAEGHEVVGAGRSIGPGQGAVSRWVRMDFAQARHPADWLPHLQGIDAMVNCVGVLQDNAREDTGAAHAAGPEALFRACAGAGIRRVVHVSAIGVDRHQASEFSASKPAGDRALMALDLDWVILRPSVVLGGPAFGASALIRGLAALPVLPVMPGTGPLQVVALEDVTRTMAFFIRPEAPARLVLDLAGPQRLDFADVVALHRGWLGWPPARRLALSGRAAGLLYRLGDLAGMLGWRPPLRSTARREIAQGADHRLAEAVGPVQPGAGQQRNRAGVDPRLQAITVELDLVQPAPAGGGGRGQGRQHRRDEIRQGLRFRALGPGEIGGRGFGLLRRGVRLALADRPGPCGPAGFLAGQFGDVAAGLDRIPGARPGCRPRPGRGRMRPRP